MGGVGGEARRGEGRQLVSIREGWNYGTMILLEGWGGMGRENTLLWGGWLGLGGEEAKR